ncbi:MAG: hypothetical protein KDC46_07840 [Thermoleophilia bacterium]|nr:hypothetical protein [Thermoleophilia bacterium]
MTSLHPALRTSFDATSVAPRTAFAEFSRSLTEIAMVEHAPIEHAPIDAPSSDEAMDEGEHARLVVALDAVADHLQDANDQLGHRASGLSMAAAARCLADALPALTRATARGGADTDPIPVPVRAARTQLRDADLALGELSRTMLGIVPPNPSEQAALDLQLCRWVDAARLLATWIDEVMAR